MSDPVDSIGVDLVSGGDPHQIMLRLVRIAAESAGADRCTLTSLDQQVIRAEASYEVGGSPDFVGRGYPLTHLEEQPLLYKAVTSRRIVTGGNLARGARTDPALAASLQEMRRTAIVPLPLGDGVGALLILSRKADRSFAEVELERVQQIGVLAALVLRNARLIDEVRNAQQRGLRALTLMSGHIASSDEPAAFFGKLSKTVADLIESSRAAFWQIVDGELVARRAAHGFTPAMLDTMRVALPQRAEESGLSRVLYSGETRRYTAGEKDAGDPLTVVQNRLGVRDLLAVPWRTAAAPLGILIACDSRAGFSDQDEWIMRLAARASALVWQGYESEQRVEQLQVEERERLRSHAARMAGLEQQKSEFLQLASHELRTPITLVSGYLSMLEQGVLGELPSAAGKVLPLLSTRMSQMNQLVDRMLATSRVEESAGGANARDFEIDDVVRAVTASTAALLSAGHHVVVDSRPDARAHADPERIETILTNLVSNAIKYSPAGGEIRIAVREEPAWLAIEVGDHGMGVNSDDIANLFQPFQRLDAAQAAGIDGTGLGLYLARRLAFLEGGDIEVQSQRNVGSTFTLRLPRASPATPERTHA